MYKKILWPIDIFAKEDFETDIKHISFLHQTLGAKVQPVYVLMPGAIDIWAGPSSMKWLESYRETAINRISDLLKKNKLNFCLSPRVIDNPRSSLRTAVISLQEFIKKEKIDFAYLRSHGRKGVDRFFLGSFAETFLLHTKIPVWLSKPKQNISIGTIIFATDFSPACKKALDPISKLATKWKATLGLFYKQHPSLDPSIAASAFGTGLYMPTQNYSEVQKKWEEKEMQSFIKKAGPKLKTIALWGSQILSIDDALNSVQKRENAGLLVMVAQATPLETYLLGSSIRAVIRSASVPLLIFPVIGSTKEKITGSVKKTSKHAPRASQRSEVFRRIY